MAADQPTSAGKKHERGVGHHIDQPPQARQAWIGVQQALAFDEHALGAQQIVGSHQQAGDDDGRQDGHEHVREHLDQLLQPTLLGVAAGLDVGDGGTRHAALLHHLGVDAVHVAGADDDLEHSGIAEMALHQRHLAQRVPVHLGFVEQ
ncbi:hypothetical protein [Chromobacterium piscinae]|uniref:hypothetical protein n=1 Tax=Chromobacterium piscinae TaxID=686831 RepID=UPI0036238EEB